MTFTIMEEKAILLFDELVNFHDYRGEDNLYHMLDFCTRFNLKELAIEINRLIRLN